MAVGREEGFNERREARRAVPALVRRGNFARSRVLLGVVVGLGGRRSVRALGRRLKAGQLVRVGGPRREKTLCNWLAVGRRGKGVDCIG